MTDCQKKDIIREAAATLLLAQPIRSIYSLPLLNLCSLRTDFDVIIDSYSSFRAKSSVPLPSPLPPGMTMKMAGRPALILYDNTLIESRKRFTIAHELGHLALCHALSSEENEREADLFAAYFLSPPVLIYALEQSRGRLDEDALVQWFGVSKSCGKRIRQSLDADPIATFSPIEMELTERLLRGTS